MLFWPQTLILLSRQNALLLFLVNTASEIFQETDQCRYQFKRWGSYDGYFKYKRNNEMCAPLDSQGNIKDAILFLLLLPLTF